MGKHDPVIIQTQSARLHALAWSDPTRNSIDVIDKDPAGPLTASVRGNFGIAADAKLIDLESYDAYDGGLAFDEFTSGELQEIFKYGTLNRNHVQMEPSEWITPDGTIIPIQQESPGISLTDWARIYAYIWYQYKFASPSNKVIRDHFEKDPAATLDKEIIADLNKLSTLPPIIYIYKTTPLITHGNPPSDPGYISGFVDISDDPNALGYRYRVRYCC